MTGRGEVIKGLLLGVAFFVVAMPNLNAFAIGYAPLFAGLGVVTVTMAKASAGAKWFRTQWLMFWIMLAVGVALLALEIIMPGSGA